MKKIISLLLILSMSLSPVLASDTNMDGDGGGSVGDGGSGNAWTTGNDGIRVSIVREIDNQVMKPPVDFSKKKQTVNHYFGYVSKIHYSIFRKLDGVVNGTSYKNIVPEKTWNGNIVSPNGTNNIESIKKYFSDSGTMRFLSSKMDMDYDTLINGEYVLLIEPIIYFLYNNRRYAATATEVALLDVMTGNDLLGKMGSLTHVNLPRSMYLIKPALGFQPPVRPFSYRSSDAEIIGELGLGTIHFKEEPPPVIRDEYVYHANTEVITAVTVTANDQYDPDEMGSVSFHINGSSYTKYFVSPPGGEQRIWVRWKTPATPQDMPITVTTKNGSLSATHITAKVILPEENPPPDPKFNDPAPKVTLSKSPKEDVTDTKRWSVWSAYWHWITSKRGEWRFYQDTYYATLKTEAILRPNARVETAFRLLYDTYEMKSGYGVDIEFKTKITYSCGDYDVTPVQNASVTFPEFDYKTYNRLLEPNGSGGMFFKENKYSYYLERAHFTPLRYPDNVKYKVSVESFDSWTPMGQLKATVNPDNINIMMNVYDDWYIRLLPVD